MPNTKIQAPKYKKIPNDNIQKLLSFLNPYMKLRQNGTVSLSIRLAARGQRLRSYETTPKWHGFLMIKLAAFQASGWAEPRTQAVPSSPFPVQG